MTAGPPVLGTPNAGGTSDVTYVWPSHQAGDILILATETNLTGGLSVPSGMANTIKSPRAQSTNVTTINAFWKRATSSSEPNAVVPATSDHQVGIPFRIRGCAASGDPWDASMSSGQSSGTSRTFSGFNTLTDDSLVVFMIVADTDTTIDNFTGFNSPSGLSSFTVLDQIFTDNGNGGGILVGYGTKAVAGYTNNLTWTFTTASLWSGIALAFPPGSAVVPDPVGFEGWGVPL